MALLSEKIEQGISETIAQWYETELNAAFANTSAKIHMAADTGGGCSALVIENIGGSGLDIVITQEASAPYLANGETCNIVASLYPHFFFHCGESAIQDMTVKAFEQHENALQHVCDLRDMALAIAKLDLRQSTQTDFIKLHIPKNDSIFNHPENQTAVIGIDCPPYGHNRILEIFLDESEADAFINNGGKNA